MTVGVRIGDIPKPLLDEIGAGLEHYFVPILGLAAEGHPDPLKLIGSGTLVRIDSQHYVLTAAHVWEATERFPTISFALTSYESWFPVPREGIAVRTLRDRRRAEFGPDLALLEISPALVPRIVAHKSVLDLSQQRRAFLAEPLPIDSGLWAVTGMSGTLSGVRTQPERRTFEADVHGRAFFGGIVQAHERDGWDYLDAGADVTLADVPQSFGGVSGGGLWQIPLSLSKNTGQLSWNGQKRFNGVAFWESAVHEGRCVIRCHGQRSLFKKAWNEWRLPN